MNEKMGEIESLNDDVMKQIEKNKKNIQMLTVDVHYVEGKLVDKFDRMEGEDIWSNFNRYARFDDFKELYNKCIPEIRKFENKIIEFIQEIEKTQIIIRRFDEMLSEKASKHNIREVYNHLSQTYTPLNDFTESKQATNSKLLESFGKIANLEEMIDLLGQSISKDIYSAVRKATMHLTKNSDSPGKGIESNIMEEVFGLVARKVDRQELIDVKNTKSNKVDTDLAFRWIDIVHKQLK